MTPLTLEEHFKLFEKEKPEVGIPQAVTNRVLRMIFDSASMAGKALCKTEPNKLARIFDAQNNLWQAFARKTGADLKFFKTKLKVIFPEYFQEWAP